MLTKHCYHKIPKDWDTKRDPNNKVFDCCFSPDPEDPTCVDCCYDSWQNQLKCADQQYKEANENAEQKKKQLAFVTDRRDRYRNWIIELDKADDITRTICSQLEVIAFQSDKIWYNSCKATEAVEVLFCMIRDFFKQVDYLEKRYEDLQVCLKANHDPSLEKGRGILKYLDEYTAKLDVIIKTRDEIIKMMVEAIKLANLVRNNISTRCCPAPDPNKPYDPCATGVICPPCDDKHCYYGFKTVICEWYNEFHCDVNCKPEDPCDDCDEQKQQQQQQQQAPAPLPVEPISVESDQSKAKCKLFPIIGFPICEDSYKKVVKKWLSADELSVRTLTTELKDLSKTKESLQACKDSLTKAIKEVNPKERCK